VTLNKTSKAPPGYKTEIIEPSISLSVWSHHEQAKANVYCSEHFAEIFHDTSHTSIVQAWLTQQDHNSTPHASFLFSVNGRHARIYGKLFSVDSPIFQACIDAILLRYPRVSVVHMEAVFQRGSNSHCNRPIVASKKNTDYILALPPDMESYENQIDRDFVKKLRYYVRRFFREHPTAKLRLFTADEISRDLVHKIVEMNRERMNKKLRVSGIDPRYEERIFRLAQKYGFVVTLTNQEDICAGTIFYRSNDSAYLHVLSHNTAYSLESKSSSLRESGRTTFSGAIVNTKANSAR
jgi:hypothetical protein